MTLEPPRAAAELARRFEGFCRIAVKTPPIMVVPYICPAGFWTIGYGHLCQQGHPPIGEAQGDLYLVHDLRTALAAVLTYCPAVAADEPRLAALTDFTFNLGSGRLKASTLRRRVNDRDWPGAREELRKWVWGGGKKLPGLVARREAEALLI